MGTVCSLFSESKHTIFTHYSFCRPPTCLSHKATTATLPFETSLLPIACEMPQWLSKHNVQSNEILPHWLKSYSCLKKPTTNVAYTYISFYVLIHAAYSSVQIHVWPLLNPINEEQKWWLGCNDIRCFFVEGLRFIRLKICRFFAALCVLNLDVISIMRDSAERNDCHQIISTSVSG